MWWIPFWNICVYGYSYIFKCLKVRLLWYQPSWYAYYSEDIQWNTWCVFTRTPNETIIACEGMSQRHRGLHNTINFLERLLTRMAWKSEVVYMTKIHKALKIFIYLLNNWTFETLACLISSHLSFHRLI